MDRTTRAESIAVVMRAEEHHSLRLYREAMLPRLERLGFTFVRFAPDSPLPSGCALVWDPGLGMRPVPSVLFASPVPVVATVLGLRTFAVPIEHVATTTAWIEWENKLKAEVLAGWEQLRPKLAGVLTISDSCAAEVVTHLRVPRRKVHAIHLAVERDIFSARVPLAPVPRDHLLHISLAGPARKNLPRMLEAYELLPRELRIPFLIKLQEDPGPLRLPEGVRIKREHCTAERLADYYRRARLLLYPSIYEGFGLPVLEALSCGCPVITSRATACAEVTGDAAVLVDPTSVQEIAAGMERILRDDAYALDLARRGTERAKAFSWDLCAQRHADVLNHIVSRTRRRSILERILFRRV